MRQFTYTTILTIFTSVAAVCLLSSIKMALVILSGICSWWMTKALIPKVRQFMLVKKIFGYDINKKGSEAG